MRKKNVIKLVLNDFNHESRDEREISALLERGHNVTLLITGKINSIEKKTSSYEVIRIKKENLKEKKNKLIRYYHIFLLLYNFIRKIIRLKPDAISCHDLLALFVGWTATRFMISKPKIIYDSHEFEIGRNTIQARSSIKNFVIRKSEKFLIGQSAFTIVVNESISNALVEEYSLKKKPIVVRNVGPLWVKDDKEQLLLKGKLKKTYDINNSSFILMYHGAITQGRGIETIIKASGKIKDATLVILGFGSEDYIKDLSVLAEENNTDLRVIPAVKFSDLYSYVAIADLGLITIPNVSASYYYMLPNKLFENIQAEVPILASNFPEIKKVVSEYKVGIVCNPEVEEEIVSSILKFKTNPKYYSEFKKNVIEAKKQLNWEQEKKKLVNAYECIL
ncbi:glycosyltransferase [Planococcus sp. S3-L1]|uniref:glycosyltransferase n=1 Tax=Planococcus sp. S3-L1 TaxID=3046200 RepID=UPI0024B98895|nr:glycosyltransferase [Planococcus sp. S3-L1]MDJ0332958.1 glycosyltransferase [Planococcus sp. S3-L1]